MNFGVRRQLVYLYETWMNACDKIGMMWVQDDPTVSGGMKQGNRTLSGKEVA